MNFTEHSDMMIKELFAGEMTPGRHGELESWLRQDKSHVRLLAEFAAIERLLFIEQKKQDASAILALLLEAEQKAEPMLMSFDDKTHKGPSIHHEPISFKQACQALGYLAAQGLRSRARVVAGLAAAVLLAILVGVFAGDEDKPGADDRTASAVHSPAAVRQVDVVATLTAERDAQWQAASGTVLPAVGAGLEPGQRLTLTAGFAQVTTARGAVAVLEAPCSIELTDDKNTIKLHNGRLLGICETESSKGFLVRTPSMDVTDLGTRFGVDATQAGATQVRVFVGKVKVTLPAGEDAAVVQRDLLAGQAVAVEQGGERFVELAQSEDRFAALQQTDFAPARRVTQIEGVHSISGQLQVASASDFAGVQETLWPVSDDAVVFHDFVGRLNGDVLVNMTDPGVSPKSPAQSGLATVRTGTDVRSYIILKTGNASDTETRVQGSVTFEDEVIGIITEQATSDTFVAAIRASSPVFNPGSGDQRWIELHAFHEDVTLSEDRRTVTFRYQVKQSSDAIRVLVRADQPDPGP